jgi:thiopeptide-type bacteriocin biosynthesis protein
MNVEWLYMKIFYGPSGQRADELLVHYVRPLAAALLEEGLIRRFFYILYSEGGPHIRLRMLGTSATLTQVVRPRLERGLEAAFERVSTIPLDTSSTWNIPITTPFPSYEYDRYEPEYEKYGGTVGMPISEAHFQDSSEIALRILEAAQTKQLKRQQAALLLTETLVDSFREWIGPRAQFYAICRDYWISLQPDTQHLEWRNYFEQRYISARPALAAQMASLKAPSGLLQEVLSFWHEQTVKTAQAFAALDPQQRATPIPFMLQGYIHMLHNRLRMTPMEEAFILHLLNGWWSEHH